MTRREEKPLPGCKAILLCERTMTKAGTGKISLIDLIGTIFFDGFPARSKPMRLFLHLVDGIGEYEIHIEVHDLAEDSAALRTTAVKVSFPDRLAPRKLIFGIPKLPLSHAGRYDVIVFGDGREIDRLQITAAVADSGDSP